VTFPLSKTRDSSPKNSGGAPISDMIIGVFERAVEEYFLYSSVS